MCRTSLSAIQTSDTFNSHWKTWKAVMLVLSTALVFGGVEAALVLTLRVSMSSERHIASLVIIKFQKGPL